MWIRFCLSNFDPIFEYFYEALGGLNKTQFTCNDYYRIYNNNQKKIYNNKYATIEVLHVT